MNFKALLFTVYAGIIAGLIITSCNKSDLFSHGQADPLLNGKISHPGELFSINSQPFNKTVGAPMDGAMGRKWIKNYRRLNNAGRLDYFLMVKDLESIWSDSSCVGICMYYAKNDRDELIILPLGINENGRIIIPNTINTENGLVDWTTAKMWMANYKGSVQAHFFGTNTFSRLTKNPECRVIRASYALDDKGNAQLLLADAAVSDPSLYEDASRPCPPFCPWLF
ncbi:MAG: hypothetical protein ACKOW2_08045 [Sphingobacteriaceae bacterium]